MRYLKYLCLWFFATCLLPACQTEEINPEVSNSLAGNWQWVSSNGGITGQDHQTPASTNTQLVIQFTSDNQFFRYQNGVKTEETTYILQQGKSIYDASGQSNIMIINGTGTRYSYRLENNELYLFDECYDCYTHHYVRMVR
ncbi:MAG: hypothetical protein COW65_11040 [Cytophagales bacterium CG18_big_fil_WC_8_21_14_2_50_42_9]|nr:MAG: hypothetical protein COW65_11040 [Cytophagales bacterium CG18_big_fil_WC_8_21_14_2_50_42_9]